MKNDFKDVKAGDIVYVSRNGIQKVGIVQQWHPTYLSYSSLDGENYFPLIRWRDSDSYADGINNNILLGIYRPRLNSGIKYALQLDFMGMDLIFKPNSLKAGDHVLITGCKTTPDARKHYIEIGTVAEVLSVKSKGSIDVKGVWSKSDSEFINQTIDAPDFELTDLPLTGITPEIKEVTMAEVEEKFGCKVKVIK